ncbi:MAG: MBL fold metallo-hydrolase [Acidimicrobiia bacterium]
MAVELTVLGCSGSYGGTAHGACSGYLLRDGDTTIWLDCGNGSFVNLQRHLDPADLTAVVITHEHPDHCVDIYGLHVMLRYGIERGHVPVFAPGGAADRLGALVEWGDTFDWNAIDDGARTTIGSVALDFARTDHPPPTFGVHATSADGRRFVYSADTGPLWSVEAFGAGADLVLSEATYRHDDRRAPLHLSGRQAGEAARAAGAGRLVLTHVWPEIDPHIIREEGSEAFGNEVTMAAVDLTTTI